jgi:hypothetical protein
MAGAVISFAFANWRDIARLFGAPPESSISVDSETKFIKENARVEIRGSDDRVVANYPMRDQSKVAISPGEYEVKIVIGDDVVTTQMKYVGEGRHIAIDVGADVLDKIRLSVSRAPTCAKPNERLDIDVDASGMGLLWIFEGPKGGDCALVFPIDQDEPLGTVPSNLVGPSRALRFPKDGTELLAPSTTGPARLCAVVTSVADRHLAIQIASTCCKATAGKAGAPDLHNNWGVQPVDFVVADRCAQ